MLGNVGKSLAVALAVIAGSACSAPVDQPSILVISIDSLRADKLHVYGDPRELSPHMDRLAGESTRFTQARSSSPWTTPSVMTLFTGLAPPSHHVDNNDRGLSPDVTLLAERLHDAGYRTGAVMPAVTLADHFGFDRGFDSFVLDAQGHDGISGPWSVEKAVEFLRGGDGPFFLYVHLWDVHYNYEAPSPYAARFEAGRAPGPGETDDITKLIKRFRHADEAEPLPEDRIAWLEGQYAAEILYTDEQVGLLLHELERLGRTQNTIVVLTGDHGEAFQEHFVLGHTVHLYDEMVHVPLMVRWPGRVRGGAVSDTPVGLIDLTPTLLDLAGVAHHASAFEGRSLVPELMGEDSSVSPPTDGLLLSTSRRGRLRGLWTPERAYIYDFIQERAELYDLAADPGQQVNLVTQRPGEAELWRRRLCERMAALPPGGEIDVVPLSQATREALDAGFAQLGYTAGPRRRPPREIQDPAKERRAFLDELACDSAASAAQPHDQNDEQADGR